MTETNEEKAATPDRQTSTAHDSPQADTASPSSPRQKDKIGKLGFALVALVGLAIIYMFQRSPASPLDKWGTSLNDALAQAKVDNRKVVALFTEPTPNHDEINLGKTTLAKEKNIIALREGRFITVRIKLNKDLTSADAKKYRIKKLPTMLLLDPFGRELNRREGFVGEMDFRSGFLDAKDVQQ